MYLLPTNAPLLATPILPQSATADLALIMSVVLAAGQCCGATVQPNE